MPGENCPVEQVIEKEKECLKALTALDLYPRNLKVNKDGRPAGCYWFKGKGYFNKITVPILTKPEIFGDRAGVCKKPGKCSIHLRLLISNKSLYKCLPFKLLMEIVLL